MIVMPPPKDILYCNVRKRHKGNPPYMVVDMPYIRPIPGYSLRERRCLEPLRNQRHENIPRFLTSGPMHSSGVLRILGMFGWFLTNRMKTETSWRLKPKDVTTKRRPRQNPRDRARYSTLQFLKTKKKRSFGSFQSLLIRKYIGYSLVYHHSHSGWIFVLLYIHHHDSPGRNS